MKMQQKGMLVPENSVCAPQENQARKDELPHKVYGKSLGVADNYEVFPFSNLYKNIGKRRGTEPLFYISRQDQFHFFLCSKSVLQANLAAGNAFPYFRMNGGCPGSKHSGVYFCFPFSYPSLYRKRKDLRPAATPDTFQEKPDTLVSTRRIVSIRP